MPSERIDVVMPMYEYPETVHETLNAFVKNTPTFSRQPFSTKLIVVDDCSPIKKFDSWYFLEGIADKYVRHKVNLGIGPTLSELLRNAATDWVVILEADALVPEGWLEKALAERDRLLTDYPNLAWLGFKVVDRNGRIVFLYRILDENGETIELPLGDDPENPAYNQTKVCTAVSNVCSLINRRAFLKVFGPDYELKKQWIDADIGMRLRKLGYITIASSVLSFTHIKPHIPTEQDQKDHDYFKGKWRKNNEEGR